MSAPQHDDDARWLEQVAAATADETNRRDLPEDTDAEGWPVDRRAWEEEQAWLERARQVQARGDDPDPRYLADQLERDDPDPAAARWERQVHAANLRAIANNREDDRMSTPQQPTRDQVAAVAAAGRLAEAEAYGRLAETTRQVGDSNVQDSVPLDREALEAQAAAARRERDADQSTTRRRQLVERTEREIREERRQRADPDTRTLVDARDDAAAGGRFAEADTLQKIIDNGNRKLDAERAAGQAKAREMAARTAHERFPFWREQDRPERGPTDRPGLHVRARGEWSRPQREERQR